MKPSVVTMLILIAVVAGAQNSKPPADGRWSPRLTLPAKAAGQTSKPSAKTDAAAGDAKKGRRIYNSYGCYQCHGYEAQGSTVTGPRLAPGPIPLDAFIAYVRQPVGDMPPYTGKILSDAELRDIYAFLETVPPPPSVKSIPLLNQ